MAPFWEKVTRTETCWEWTAGVTGSGYGYFWDPARRTMRRAHRVAYELLVGPIPDGLDLDHLCRNRTCVNPAHLEPVTRRENLLRGTGDAARALDRYCARGHEFTSDNTYIVPGTSRRRCKTCAKTRRAEREAAAV